MKKAKKYVSAMLACAIGLLPAGITGCSKNIRDLFVKDSPWYSFRKFEVCDQYIKDQPVNSCFTLFAGADGDNLYFYTSGEYKVPDDADWENVDYADYRFANLDVYDKYGNLIKTIDLYHSIDFSSVAYEGQQISEIYYHPFCVNTIKDGKVVKTLIKKPVKKIFIEATSDFTELVERSDIVDVVGSYVHLQKRGNTYFGLCPFHSEKTPSFSVNPAKGIYIRSGKKIIVR